MGRSVGQSSRAQKMHVVEMMMVRWMCGHIRSDKIRNEDIRDKVGVTYVVENKRSETEIIWIYEEEIRTRTNEEVQRIGYRGYEERQR